MHIWQADTIRSAYKTGNKYDIDQTIGNGFSHNASDGRTYIQARLDYNRLFSNRHEVTAMLLANRGNRTVNNELAYHSQGYHRTLCLLL